MDGWMSLLQMMFLINILLKAGSQVPPEGFRFASYYVTIPKILTLRFQEQEIQDVNYLIQIKGKNRMVHLRQQRGLVSKHFPIFTYSNKGQLQVDYPFLRDDCYYRGFVRGVPLSTVTLSTCSGGLRGLFQLENETYEIEPILSSTTFQHLVYRLKEREDGVRVGCGVRDEGKRPQGATMQKTKSVEFKTAAEGSWWTHTRYVDMVIVVEHNLYLKFDSNETLVALKILDIIHAGNSVYKPLGVHITLLGLEIWSTSNLAAVEKNMNITLNRFESWRNKNLLKRLPHDAAQLFIHTYFEKTGLAFTSTVCQHFSSGVVRYTTSSLILITNTFTHELGHNLGMPHDGKYCFCGLKHCIMYPDRTEYNKFSNCSYQAYFRLKDRSCLLTPPDPEKIFKQEQCGNKVVEKGEQCDCGSEIQCQQDPCCLPNCTLSSGAACASGKCCRNCQHLPAGTVCRDMVSRCDLPEYCNGTSELCPEDFYVQNGAPCSGGAFCFNGLCNTHDGQCQAIFGSQARMASDTCFRIFNSMGDRFGNCGLKNGIYRKCHIRSYLCGRIQCENVIQLPSLEEHTTIMHFDASGRHCWSTDYHSGISMADVGAVKDGTPCDASRICLNSVCKKVKLPQYDVHCNTRKCHNQGLCNNHHYCHCDYGWAPPDCNQSGYGGSSVSGPAPPPSLFISRGSVILIALIIPAFCCITLWLLYKVIRFQLRTILTISPVESSSKHIHSRPNRK